MTPDVSRRGVLGLVATGATLLVARGSARAAGPDDDEGRLGMAADLESLALDFYERALPAVDRARDGGRVSQEFHQLADHARLHLEALAEEEVVPTRREFTHPAGVFAAVGTALYAGALELERTLAGFYRTCVRDSKTDKLWTSYAAIGLNHAAHATAVTLFTNKSPLQTPPEISMVQAKAFLTRRTRGN